MYTNDSGIQNTNFAIPFPLTPLCLRTFSVCWNRFPLCTENQLSHFELSRRSHSNYRANGELQHKRWTSIWSIVCTTNRWAWLIYIEHQCISFNCFCFCICFLIRFSHRIIQFFIVCNVTWQKAFSLPICIVCVYRRVNVALSHINSFCAI